TDRGRSAARELNLTQRAIRPEPDPLSIRRKERALRVVRAGHRRGLEPFERALIELALSAFAGAEHERSAIGRQRGRVPNGAPFVLGAHPEHVGGRDAHKGWSDAGGRGLRRARVHRERGEGDQPRREGTAGGPEKSSAVPK